MKTHHRRLARWKAGCFPSVWDLTRAYVEESSAIDEQEKAVLYGHIRARDPFRILRWCEQAEAFSSLSRCREILQLKAFFSKNADAGLSRQKHEAARQGFLLAERLCRITNKRLDFYARHPERHPFKDEEVAARGLIARVLGSTKVALEGLPAHLKLTSGATSTDPRTRSKPYMKIRKTYTVTERAIPFVRAFLRFHGFPGLPSFIPTTVNQVMTVPKNLKTDRTIAKEPIGNLPFQLAFDGLIKQRLRQVGIDLQDQSRNQLAAREGSVTGMLATIDLSMASDTLSINTVASLLPDDWFCLLDALRCPAYTGPFGDGIYAKFSSMGNGYTFPLETLVFWALCKSVGSVEPLVYGDDIIIESHLAPRLVQLLRFYGFRINLDKSFTKGPFRESCGADWYEGVNVRAFYWKQYPRTILEANVTCNALLARTRPGGPVWNVLKSHVPYARFVPFGADSSSGIVCHPRDVYLRPCPDTHAPRFKGAVRFVKEPRVVRDVRAYYLWHLRASKRGMNQPLPQWFGLRGCHVYWKDIQDETDVEDDEDCDVFVRDGWLTLRMSAAPIPQHIYVVGEYFAAKAAL